VLEALSYWKDIGYEFADLLKDFPCLDGFIEGSITIGLANQEYLEERTNENAVASTRVIADLSGNIQSARIIILTKAERVLEHEIGHSLGWRHFDLNNHMMHPELNIGGWDSYGLEYK